MNIVLEPITDEPVTITDKHADGSEKTYKADPEMTAAEALSFIMAVTGGATPDAAPDALMRQMATVLGRCLKPYHPELATADAVLAEFSLRKIWAITSSFLALSGRVLSAPKEPSAAPAPEASENTSPTTPMTEPPSA